VSSDVVRLTKCMVQNAKSQVKNLIPALKCYQICVYNRNGVFTARYALSHITQIRLVLKGQVSYETENTATCARFEVVTSVLLGCRLVNINRRFEGFTNIRNVSDYQTTWCNIPEELSPRIASADTKLMC
jgi:uracil DNA glycosylase